MAREIGLIASGPSRYFSSPFPLFIDICMCTYVSSLSLSLSHCRNMYACVYMYAYIHLSLIYTCSVWTYIYIYFPPTRLLRIQVYMYLSYSFIPNLTYISLSLSLVGSFCISERAIALAMGMNRWLDCDPRR